MKTRLLTLLLVTAVLSPGASGRSKPWGRWVKGEASWYKAREKDKKFGTPYGFVAASNTLPWGATALVRRGSKTVKVTIVGPGPYKSSKGRVPHPTRIIDLSREAATALGITGVARVSVCWYGSISRKVSR